MENRGDLITKKSSEQRKGKISLELHQARNGEIIRKESQSAVELKTRAEAAAHARDENESRPSLWNSKPGGHMRGGKERN